MTEQMRFPLKMSTNTFKVFQFLILFIALLEPNTCAVVSPKANRLVEQPPVPTLNLKASQTDDRFLQEKFDKYKQLDKVDQLDRLDRLQANEQSSNSVFVPSDLNENIEESTKNVVLWTPENCKFAFQVWHFSMRSPCLG